LSAHGVGQAQTAPVDAGQLLEQQRRLEQPARPAPAPALTPPLRDGAAADAAARAGGARVTVRRFTLVGHTLLGEDALQDVLRPWLGRPLSLGALRQAAAAVEQAYRDAGWLAHVALPSQDVTDGQLRLEITEARLGGVRMTAAPAHVASTAPSTPALSPRLQARVEAMLNAGLDAGEPLALGRLERALQLADELPGVNVGGSLQAGARPGSTEVQVQVAAAPRLHGDVSVDNAANRSTGRERLNASLRLSSPWSLGEQIDLAASTTYGTGYLRAGASLPIGLGGWRVGVNTSALRYRVLGEYDTSTGLAPRGSSQTVGADAQYPLLRSARARWNAVLGVEQRRQSNRDDNSVAGVMDVTTRARSRVLSMGVSGQVVDAPRRPDPRRRAAGGR
jgi:hemolysin activation/secretion protein